MNKPLNYNPSTAIVAGETSVLPASFKSDYLELPATNYKEPARETTDEGIRNSEEKRRLIMNAALDAIICIDIKGDITFWNPKAEVIFGWKESEVIGKPLSRLIIPEQYRKRHDAGMALYLKTGEGPALNKLIELSAINRSAEEFPIELTIMPIRQGGEEFFCAFIRDITERKKADKVLQAAYEEKNTVLERIDDGFFAVDTNAIITYWNNKAEILLNVKREDVIGKNLHELFAPTGSPVFYDNYQKASREKSTVHFEGYSKRSNKWFAVSAYGSDNGLSVYFQDVTERKNSEDKIKESELRYGSLIELATDTICIADRTFKFIEMNPSGCQMFGYTREEMLQLHMTDVLFEEDLQINPIKIEELKNGKITSNERRIKRKDGSAMEVELNGRMLEDGRIIVFGRDISERKKAENKLKESELRYRSIIEQATDAICIADASMKIIDVNPYCCQMLGYTKEEFLLLTVADIFLPEDLKTNPFKIAELQSGKVIRNERRFKRKDGTIIEVEMSGRILKDGRFIVFGHDIAERKKAEDKLKESELRYRSLNEQATDAICITDATLKFININPYACETFGYTEEEALQLSLPDILFAEDLADNPIKLKELKLGKTVRNEQRLKRKDGTAIHMDVSTKLMEDGRMIMYGHDITARKKAEELIFKAENLFRVMIEKSTDMKTLSTRDGEMIYSSPSITKVLGYSPEEFCLKSAYGIIHPDDITGYREKRKEIMQTPGKSFHNQNRFLHKNGNWVWCEGIVTNMLHEPGVNALVSNFRDISEKKTAEQEDEFNRNNLNAIINNTNDLMWSVDTDFRLITSNKPFEEMSMINFGKIITKGSSVLDVSYSPEMENHFKKLYERAFNGEAFIQTEYFDMPTEFWSEISYFPIRNGNEIIGTACYSRDITERKRSEINLAESEKRYRQIVETAQEGIWLIDENKQTTFVNKRICDMLGYTAAEMLGKDLFHFMDDEGKQLAVVSLEIQKKIGADNLDFKFLTKTGTTVWTYLVTSSILDEDGNYIGGLAMVTDITERRKIDESNKFKAELLNTVGQAVIATNMNGIVNFWNKAAEDNYGWTTEEAIGKHIIDLTTAQQSKEQAEEIMKKLSLGHSWAGEFIVKRKDGSNFPAYVTNAPIYDKQHRLAGIIGVSSDITERKQIELNLKESNERYNLISKATNDMVWDWNLETDTVNRNKEGWKKIFRTVDKDVENGLMADWDKRIHPEDAGKVQLVDDEIHKSLKDFFEVECRMLRDDGTYAYIHDRGYIMRNAQGKAMRLLGATQDITARKEAELQVTKSELRFRSLVQNSSDLISIVNDRGYYLYCSPAVKRILGYEAEYIVGKNAFSLIHPDDISNLKAHLLKNKTQYAEIPAFRFKNAQGEWRWLETKVSDLNDNPEVLGYVFNSRDVTEKILLQRTLEQERFAKQKEITEAVISAQEQERQELGSELHDNITQILAGSRLYLGLVKTELKDEYPYLNETDNLIKSAIDELRNLSHSLIPPSLNESDLLEAIKTIIERTQLTSGIQVSLDAPDFDETLIPEKLNLTIYRIVQEQINNILKHADAKKVCVRLFQNKEKIVLSIKDDGIGFNTKIKAKGVGLMNIQTRAALFNGELKIISAPGNGCELRVSFN